MSDVNQIINDIKEEITSPEPSSNRIINHLYDLRPTGGFSSLSDSEFYDIVGETFKLNPEFFMESIYGTTRTRFFRKREMAKYIIEKFCLYDGEQILYEFQGDIKQVDDIQSNIRVLVTGGTIFVTNYRIIAQGTPSVKGHSINALIWGGPVAHLLSGGSKRAKSGESLIEASLGQELPCYGYQFKRKNYFRFHKKSKGVRYSVVSDNVQNMSGASTFKQLRTLSKAMRIITITPPIEQRDELFEILIKEDVDQIVDRFRGLHDMGLRKDFLKGLRSLWEIKEYRYLSDSEKLDAVLAVYEIDPELFMSSIYPEMKTWNFPSFLRVKEDLFEKVLKKEQ